MQIPIVNENDEIIEYKDKKEADKNPELIYRVSSLWVTNTDGKILLAQRAFNKKHDPGKWGPAVAGTVEEGETYESNIIKETEEEIGLKNIKLIPGTKKRKITAYNYFVQEFLLTLPAGFNDFEVQKDEVEQIKWFTEEELKKKLAEHPDDFLKGIHERMNNLDNTQEKKHIVIFSHEFGVKKDSRGLFTDIIKVLENTKPVIFDYNEVNEDKKTITVRKFSEQVSILKDIVDKEKSSNSNSIIDIVCHSQGSIIVALAKPISIRKIILIAPSFDTNIDRMLNIFKSRPETEINIKGISKLSRRDGSFTIVPPEYWVERASVEPIDLYNQLSKSTELIIINANQDEVLGEVNFTNLNKGIEIIKINGDHNFNGEYRSKLLEMLKAKLK